MGKSTVGRRPVRSSDVHQIMQKLGVPWVTDAGGVASYVQPFSSENLPEGSAYTGLYHTTSPSHPHLLGGVMNCGGRFYVFRCPLNDRQLTDLLQSDEGVTLPGCECPILRGSLRFWTEFWNLEEFLRVAGFPYWRDGRNWPEPRGENPLSVFSLNIEPDPDRDSWAYAVGGDRRIEIRWNRA